MAPILRWSCRCALIFGYVFLSLSLGQIFDVFLWQSLVQYRANDDLVSGLTCEGNSIQFPNAPATSLALYGNLFSSECKLRPTLRECFKSSLGLLTHVCLLFLPPPSSSASDFAPGAADVSADAPVSAETAVVVIVSQLDRLSQACAFSDAVATCEKVWAFFDSSPSGVSLLLLRLYCSL